MQAFIKWHGQKHRQGQTGILRARQMSTQINGRGLISRGLDKRGNPGTRQEIRNQTTRQHEKTRLNYNETRKTRTGSVKQLTLGE